MRVWINAVYSGIDDQIKKNQASLQHLLAELRSPQESSPGFHELREFAKILRLCNAEIQAF